MFWYKNLAAEEYFKSSIRNDAKLVHEIPWHCTNDP